MVRQHRELHLQLEDVEKLRRYAQSVVSKHHALDDALDKAKSRSKHWEQKAMVGIKRMISVEKERDEAKEEAQNARLVVFATGDAKARVEDNLARVQDALVIAEDVRHKVEVEVARLEVEWTLLMLEIGATKDEVSSLHS